MRTTTLLIMLSLTGVVTTGCTGVDVVTYDEIATECVGQAMVATDVAEAVEQGTDPAALVALIAVKASDCLKPRKDWSCSNVEAVCTDPAGTEHDLTAEVVDMIYSEQ